MRKYSKNHKRKLRLVTIINKLTRTSIVKSWKLWHHTPAMSTPSSSPWASGITGGTLRGSMWSLGRNKCLLVTEADLAGARPAERSSRATGSDIEWGSMAMPSSVRTSPILMSSTRRTLLRSRLSNLILRMISSVSQRMEISATVDLLTTQSLWWTSSPLLEKRSKMMSTGVATLAQKTPSIRASLS